MMNLLEVMLYYLYKISLVSSIFNPVKHVINWQVCLLKGLLFYIIMSKIIHDHVGLNVTDKGYI